MLYESRNFRLEAQDQVATLWFEFRDRTSNSLTTATLNELTLVVDRLAALAGPDVILFRSSRPESFLEDFDAVELSRFASPLEFAALARRGQEVARKIAALGPATVAVISGSSTGAGLELALACAFRLATDSPATRFAFPAVTRGLIPCCGGTTRLPRLIGPLAARRLFESFSAIDSRTAKYIGIVDALLPVRRFDVDLTTFVDRCRGRAISQRRAFSHRLRSLLLPFESLARRQPLNAEPTARSELRKTLTSGLSSEGEGLTAERMGIARLAACAETRRLLHLHATAATPSPIVPTAINPLPPHPTHIGIVGTSEVAVFLAARLAERGHAVVLQSDADRRPTFKSSLNIRQTSEWVGFDRADLVIESGHEDPGIKRNLMNDLERIVRPRVPLLTTATSIPVESIQTEMDRPYRVAGLHFPDIATNIVELIGTSLTDPGIVAAIAGWVRQWGFVPVRVADRPGRLVHLIRMTYLSEGVALVAEGLPIDQIDSACRRFGMARGPLEWCDEIGFENLAEQAAQMQLARGDGFARNLLFQRLLPYGCVGREVGEGFYRYGIRMRPSQVTRMVLWQDLDEDARAPYVFDLKEALRDGVERLMLRTVNEAAAALADEPDSDPRTVDLAVAFGMGWAPQRGGPLRYADTLGMSVVVERLAEFAERFGPRFTPCDELVRRAEAGESFYGLPSSEVESPILSMHRAA